MPFTEETPESCKGHRRPHFAYLVTCSARDRSGDAPDFDICIPASSLLKNSGGKGHYAAAAAAGLVTALISSAAVMTLGDLKYQSGT